MYLLVTTTRCTFLHCSKHKPTNYSICSLIFSINFAESPYLSQLRKAKQKSGSSLDKPESPGHRKPILTRTQSAPEFNVPRELCQTYSARMDRAALAIGVCPGCKTQLVEEHDSPTRVSDCKNMHHYSCLKCNSEYDVHR